MLEMTIVLKATVEQIEPMLKYQEFKLCTNELLTKFPVVSTQIKMKNELLFFGTRIHNNK